MSDYAALCQGISRSTGKPCQQPERWLELVPPEGLGLRVCQVHGRMLERQGAVFVRELWPVPGFERLPERAAPSFQLRDDLALLERAEPGVGRVVVAEWTRGEGTR